MKWIGLTGTLAGGKSSVGRYLREKGYQVIDADAVVHSLLCAGGLAVEPIVQFFGKQVLDETKGVDRKKIASLVFNSKAQLEDLERILHPMVRKEVQLWRQNCERAGHSVAFYEVPLLFEKKMQSQFDAIWVVDAPRELREDRAQHRSGWDIEQFGNREANQVHPREKRTGATEFIWNYGDENQLKRSVDEALQRLNLPAAHQGN